MELPREDMRSSSLETFLSGDGLMQLTLVTSADQGAKLDNPQKCIPTSAGLFVILQAMEEANLQAGVNSTDVHLRFFFSLVEGKKNKKRESK